MKKYALIVAGGKGTRMKRSIAKQYIPIKGLPILMHTLKQFNDSDNSLTLILVIPELDFEYWRQPDSNGLGDRPGDILLHRD